MVVGNLLVGIRRVKKTLGLVMGLLQVINLVGAMIELVAGVKARLLMKVEKMVVGKEKMHLMRIMDPVGAKNGVVVKRLVKVGKNIANPVIGVIQMLPTRICHLVGIINSMQMKKLVGLEIMTVVGIKEKLLVNIKKHHGKLMRVIWMETPPLVFRAKMVGVLLNLHKINPLVGIINPLIMKKMVMVKIKEMVGTVEKLQMAALQADGGRVVVGKMG